MRISPIFDWELIAIARRERYYVIRWIYGIVLFVFIFGPILLYGGMYSSQELEHRTVAVLNEVFFAVIMVVQGLAVLTLVPALVAGAIAEEKQRRGFEIVLTTTLSSFEIVIGKLLARMCQLVVILSLSVPVFCLLSMNGGVEVGLVALGYLVAHDMAISARLVGDRRLDPLHQSAPGDRGDLSAEIAWRIYRFLPWPSAMPPGPPTISSRIHDGMVVVPRWVGMTNRCMWREDGLADVERADRRSAEDDGLTVGHLHAARLRRGPRVSTAGLRARSSDSRSKPLSFVLSRRTFRPRARAAIARCCGRSVMSRERPC